MLFQTISIFLKKLIFFQKKNGSYTFSHELESKLI
jgi:hypothetical protein